MGERDQRGGGHLPLERDRQVDDDHDQERDQALKRLLGDLAAPAAADELGADLVGREVEGAADRVPDAGLLCGAQLVGAHVPAGGAGIDVGDLLDDGVTAAARLAHRGPHLGDGGVAGRELEDRAALEVDAEVEPEDQQGHHTDREDQARDGVPQPLAAHEVERDLAPVQAAADATERGHHASFAGLVRAGTRAAGRGEARHGARAPRRLGSSPDSGCPCP